MAGYVLMVMLSTQFNSSIEFQEFRNKENCEIAMNIARKKFPDADIECTPK